MVNNEKILDLLEIHAKEFERVFKCLNKTKLPSQRIVQLHIKTLIFEYNFITNLLNANAIKADQNLTLAIHETLIKFQSKIIKIFVQIDLQIVVPEVGNVIDLDDNIFESSFDTDNNDDTIINSEIEIIDEDETMTVIEFINFATRAIPEFNGTPSELQRFIDAVNLVKANVGTYELTAVEVVKTKLKDSARNFVTNEATLEAIIDTLKANIKPESHQLIISKLQNLKQANKSANEYVKEVEILSTVLKRAYICEGLSASLAKNFTTDNVLQSIKASTVNDKVKAVLNAGKFSSVSEVFEKFLSVKFENGQSNPQINYFQRRRFENFRGNQRFYRGNSVFYRGNNYQGNYGRNSFNQGKQNYSNNGNKNFRGKRQIRYAEGNSNDPQSTQNLLLGDM